MKIAKRDEKSFYQVTNPSALNDQGKTLKFLADDILVTMNGEPIPEPGLESQAFFNKQKQNMKEGALLTYQVLRAGENNEMKEVTLQAPIQQIERKRKHNLEINVKATPEQVALREHWLSPK